VDQPIRILVAYSMGSAHISTTRDYLMALKRHSKCDVSYVNVTHNGELDFDLNEFDVVFHNYCARLCFENYVTPAYQQALAAFKGLKIMAVQDEYDRTYELRNAIARCGFDIVLSAASPVDHPYIYDSENTPNVAYKHVLTGYAPEPNELPEGRGQSLADRQITIGYRGRDIGARYGLLGYNKFEIGRRMAQECRSRGIKHDIETSEEARIYGPAWFDFIGSCRTMLGTESGSNVFDFDGKIEAWYKELKASGDIAAIAYEAFLPQVAEKETKVGMSEISPRIFECAAMHTPMILFPGRYSDILVPDRHYIPLEKDFSNLEEVLAKVEDLAALKIMADQTYNDLIASEAYSYKAYSGFIECLIRNNPRRRAIPHSAGTFSATPQRVTGPGAEGPTSEPLGLSGYQMRQWGWLALQIPGERDAIISQYSKGNEHCMDRSKVYAKVCADLNLDNVEIKAVWAKFYAAVEKCETLKTVRDNYVPLGSRDIDFEVGYLCETSNYLQTAFLDLQNTLDPVIAALQKEKPWSFAAISAFVKTRVFDRATIKAVLSKVPLLARITNRYL
jgi:hypothetical protein